MQNCVSTDVGYKGNKLVRLKEGSMAREKGGRYVKKGGTWKSPLHLASPMWISFAFGESNVESPLICIWRFQHGLAFWRFHVGFSKCKGDSTLESPNAKDIPC